MTETQTPFQTLTTEMRDAQARVLTATHTLDEATTTLADAYTDQAPTQRAHAATVLFTYRGLLRALTDLAALAPCEGRRPATQWTIDNAGRALNRADDEHRGAFDEFVPASFGDGSY